MNENVTETKDKPTIGRNMRLIKVFLMMNHEAFGIVWTSKECDGLFEAKYYEDIRDIRHSYPGQTYMYFPICHSTDNGIPSVRLAEDGEESAAEGYVLVSKRIFKTMYPQFKYFKASQFKEMVLDSVKKFIGELNMIPCLEAKQKIRKQ